MFYFYFATSLFSFLNSFIIIIKKKLIKRTKSYKTVLFDNYILLIAAVLIFVTLIINIK